ncbi:unnamed protein product [Rotaria sp. Silwood1]|nr:unnamed protein product [Rotaria sp. Silwood1]
MNQSGFIQQVCKYGHESDSSNCNRCSHPTSILVIHLFKTTTTSRKRSSYYYNCVGIQVVDSNYPLVNGNIIHMILHFYLQRSETRDVRHQILAKQFVIDIQASITATYLVVNQSQHLNYAQIQRSLNLVQFIYYQIANIFY